LPWYNARAVAMTDDETVVAFVAWIALGLAIVWFGRDVYRRMSREGAAD
jgi:hypothetical protein